MFTKAEIKSGELEWFSPREDAVVFSLVYFVDKVSKENDPYLMVQHTNDEYPISSRKLVSYRIQLAATEPLYGGQRWCFLCPGACSGEPCNRIALKLYLPRHGHYFACRRCYNLCYRTQQQNARKRALTRAQAIRRRLGGSGSIHEPIPRKPPRMRWRTYEQLCEKVDDAERHYHAF
jgi:hypothetical protein